MIFSQAIIDTEKFQYHPSLLGAMANDRRAVGCKVKDPGLFFSLPSFSNCRFPGASRYCDADNTRPQFVGGSV